MPNETGGPWVMGEPTTNRAEHKCVDGATKYFRADKCVACLTARLAAAEADASHYEAAWKDSEAKLAECRRLLREACMCEEHGVFMEQRWFDEAAKAGGVE